MIISNLNMAESAAACNSSITIASTTTTSDSETEGSSVSLLDKLKAPKPSDLSRKRKIAVNPPPTGKRRSKRSSVPAVTEP